MSEIKEAGNREALAAEQEKLQARHKQLLESGQLNEFGTQETLAEAEAIENRLREIENELR